ncbi:13831_t:CDS:2 [Racocetra fulgida]|uniref:13831_t:CDS:1 n=1 Tax=Racocetra fulgida TaxID=60492 RepID=A0A9N9AQS0_9GLOM|nr:13831_t:CDS:2 [Racocetra fulgida]
MSESESPEIIASNETVKATTTNKDPEVANTNESPKTAATNESPETAATNESPETAATNESPKATVVNKKRKKNNTESWVFREGHFKHNPQREHYAKYTYCGNGLKHDNTTRTSSLIRHLRNTNCKKHLKVNESQQTLQLSAAV